MQEVKQKIFVFCPRNELTAVCLSAIIKSSQNKDGEVIQMIDKNKLLGRIRYAGYTQNSFSQIMGMSQNSFSAKVNGKSYFDTEQIIKMCTLLGITEDSEKVNIFLLEASRNRDNHENIA